MYTYLILIWKLKYCYTTELTLTLALISPILGNLTAKIFNFNRLAHVQLCNTYILSQRLLKKWTEHSCCSIFVFWWGVGNLLVGCNTFLFRCQNILKLSEVCQCTGCVRQNENPTRFKIVKEPLLVQKQRLHQQKALDFSFYLAPWKGAWHNHEGVTMS